MQTFHRLRRFRDLRAVSSGAKPPADGVPSPTLVAPDQEARPAFPNPSWPSLARLGSRPAAPVALVGTGPGSGAVPRGCQYQRAIRFRLSRERDRLPDRVCLAALVRQTLAHLGDGRAHRWQHDRPPVGVAACLPERASECLPGWQADCLAVCMSGRLHVQQSACVCPLPGR
jgi:hypothetical protein